MASTLTASTMTVTLTESINLNRTNQGSSNSLSLASIAEVSKRIVTCPTSEITLVSFGAAAAAGTFIDADVRYVRITNLDDTNFVMLNIEGEGTTDITLRLDASASLMLIGSLVNYADTGAYSLENLTGIKADADTASCDLEIFVASA